MKSQDILNFETIISQKLAYKKRVEGKAFQTAAQIVVTSDYPQGYILKSSYNMLDINGLKVKAVHHKVSENDFDLSKVVLTPKYPQEWKIDKAKLKDLEYLKQYMSEAEGSWIKDLIEQQKSDKVQASVSELVEDQDEIELEHDELDQDYDYDEHVSQIS